MKTSVDHMLGAYGIVVVVFLLALAALGVHQIVREWKAYRLTGEGVHGRNAVLWGMGTAMCLFTALFVLTKEGWCMGAVIMIGTASMYDTVGNGVRNQLGR